MQRIKKAYAENGDLKIIPETPPLDGSENWEQGRGAYFELDNDPNTGDPLALDIDRGQDNYFKNIISNNIKHWQENSYPIWFNDIKYPKNAIVKYTNGNIYASKVDNNTTLPTDTINWTIYNPSSLDGQFVKLTGNQTIAGDKTFSSSPIVPTPTTNTQAANKQYVDSKTLNINTLPDKPTPDDTDNLALQETGGVLKKLSWVNLKATLFDGAISLTENGYIKFPTVIGGLVIQWGLSDYGANYSFPLTFPNSVFGMTGSQVPPSGFAAPDRLMSPQYINNSSYRISSNVASPATAFWIAIGH